MVDEGQAAAAAAKGAHGVVSYITLMGLAVAGGLVRFLRLYRPGTHPWKLVLALGALQVFTSAFVGLLAGFGAAALELSVPATYCLAGVAGFGGANLLKVAEDAIASFLKRSVGGTDDRP